MTDSNQTLVRDRQIIGIDLDHLMAESKKYRRLNSAALGFIGVGAVCGVATGAAAFMGMVITGALMLAKNANPPERLMREAEKLLSSNNDAVFYHLCTDGTPAQLDWMLSVCPDDKRESLLRANGYMGLREAMTSGNTENTELLLKNIRTKLGDDALGHAISMNDWEVLRMVSAPADHTQEDASAKNIRHHMLYHVMHQCDKTKDPDLMPDIQHYENGALIKELAHAATQATKPQRPQKAKTTPKPSGPNLS